MPRKSWMMIAESNADYRPSSRHGPPFNLRPPSRKSQLSAAASLSTRSRSDRRNPVRRVLYVLRRFSNALLPRRKRPDALSSAPVSTPPRRSRRLVKRQRRPADQPQPTVFTTVDQAPFLGRRASAVLGKTATQEPTYYHHWALRSHPVTAAGAGAGTSYSSVIIFSPPNFSQAQLHPYYASHRVSHPPRRRIRPVATRDVKNRRTMLPSTLNTIYELPTFDEWAQVAQSPTRIDELKLL